MFSFAHTIPPPFKRVSTKLNRHIRILIYFIVEDGIFLRKSKENKIKLLDNLLYFINPLKY